MINLQARKKDCLTSFENAELYATELLEILLLS